MEAILFDLDGTLVDTTELILACYRHTLSLHLGHCPPDEEILEGFGTPLVTQLGRFATGELGGLVDVYQEFHTAHHDELIRPIADVPEVLATLSSRGYVLGVVTSKARGPARMSLDRFELGRHFRLIVTSEDTARHKPNPEPILFALSRLGLSPDRAVYVGDSAHDLVAGRAAGVKTAAALWGPCLSHDLLSYEPDYALHSICDLLHLCSPLDSPARKMDNAGESRD